MKLDNRATLLECNLDYDALVTIEPIECDGYYRFDLESSTGLCFAIEVDFEDCIFTN